MDIAKKKEKPCKRCKKNRTSDLICQSCKSELLVHYEASLDWQMAYEMERAQMSVLRYSHSKEDEF